MSQNHFPADVQSKNIGNVSAAVLDAIVGALQLDDWVTPCIPAATTLTATARSPWSGRPWRPSRPTAPMRRTGVIWSPLPDVWADQDACVVYM